MKIALVLERFEVSRGGAEGLGAEVTIVARTVGGKAVTGENFRTAAVDGSGWTRSGSWRQFQRAVEMHVGEEKYDIVHSMVPLDSADVYQPRGGSQPHGQRRHYASYRSGWRLAWKERLAVLNRGRQARQRSEQTLCTGTEGPVIAALSVYVAEQFRQDYDTTESRIRIIRNGVAVDRISSPAARAEGEKLRQLYDREGDRAVFLFAAENFRLKGLDWLIRSAARVGKQRWEGQRDFVILVVSGQMYQNYWRQADRLGLNGRVLFLGPTEHMPALVQMCDAVVLPTYNDASSRVVLEGLAAGKPAITTRYNGAAEFMRHGEHGFIIEQVEDEAALAGALADLCDRRRQEQMSRAIMAEGLPEAVSMERHARELLALYSECISDSGKTDSG